MFLVNLLTTRPKEGPISIPMIDDRDRPLTHDCGLGSLVDHVSDMNRRHFLDLHRFPPPPLSQPSASRREEGEC